MSQPITLNSIEILVFIAVLSIQFCRLIIRKIPTGELILTMLCCVPVTYFVSSGCTRFLSWDESYIFYDIVNYRTSTLTQWNFGSFRTSITLWGPFFSAVQSLTHITKDITLVLVKSVHLIFGVLLITIVIDQLHSCFFAKTRQSIFHAVLFNAVMFLPVTSLALKTLNYDMLSMVLGVLGILLCSAGIVNHSKKRIFSAIIILTLAAHEKLIASPFLWTGMIVSVYALSWPSNKMLLSKLVSRLVMWSFAIPAISLLVIVTSFTYINITNGSSFQLFTAQQLLLAYTSSLWPFCNLFHTGSLFFTNSSIQISFFSELIIFLKGFLVIAGILFTSSSVLITIVKIIAIRKMYTAIPRINRAVSKLNFVVLSLITVTGIVAGYTLKANIWPLISTPDGYYIPQATFNNIALQFRAKTAVGHTLLSSIWACAVYTNALPTVLLSLMLLGALITVLSQERYTVNQANLLLNIFTLICICIPIGFGVLQLPLYSRYFNLFLLGATLSLISQTIKWFDTRRRAFLLMYSIGFIFLIIESYPFQPFVASFRPLWSNGSTTVNTHPSPGQATPWYPGWGEELPEAYERLSEYIPTDTEEIRLYYNFPSALFSLPEKIKTSAMPKGHGQLPYRYSDHDFYIISRNGVSTYSYIPFPYDIEPLFTIENRGFVKAWVYCGRDLYNNGFSF